MKLCNHTFILIASLCGKIEIYTVKHGYYKQSFLICQWLFTEFYLINVIVEDFFLSNNQIFVNIAFPLNNTLQVIIIPASVKNNFYLRFFIYYGGFRADPLAKFRRLSFFSNSFKNFRTFLYAKMRHIPLCTGVSTSQLFAI